MTAAKTTGGNFLEDFETGRVIKHAVPRTVWDGDMALYIALYGDRRPLNSSASRCTTFSSSTWFSGAPCRTFR